MAHALIIAISKEENGPNYKAFRQGGNIRPVVRILLDTTTCSTCPEVGIPELIKFQEHFRDYKITVYQDLVCEGIMFEGQDSNPKRINILYDDVERNYHVIVNVTGRDGEQVYV